MKKFKVEITKTYCIDVLSSNEADAIEDAETLLDGLMIAGAEHYHQTGDTLFTAYDVTNTDDPFNPLN